MPCYDVATIVNRAVYNIDIWIYTLDKYLL